MRRDIILFKIILVSVRAGFYGSYDLFNLVDSGSNHGKERKAAGSYKGLCSMGAKRCDKILQRFLFSFNSDGNSYSIGISKRRLN